MSLFEFLDPLVEGLIPILLGPFTHVSFGFIAFLTLIFLALSAAFFLSIAARKVNSQVLKALEVFRWTDSEAHFTRSFHEIDKKLKGLPALSRTWEEFTETLIEPLPGVDDPSYKVYRNTQRPDQYFNEVSVHGSVRPFIESERLIGIGLLLTFIGLVAALTQAALVFVPDSDPKVIQDALSTLLKTAGAKFLASVGGLGGAIILAIFQSKIQRDARKVLDNFNDVLERSLVYASSERILADQYGHAQRQTARLEEMGTEITLALGDKITSAMENIPKLMGKEFQTALIPLEEHIKSTTSEIAKGSTESLAEMVTKFEEQMKGASEASMNSVVAELESLSSTLQTVVTGMAQSNAEMRATLNESLSALRETSEMFKTSVGDSADAASNQLGDLLSQMQAQQVATADAISSLVAQFKATSAEMSENIKDASNNGATQIASGIDETLGKILESAGNSARNIGNDVGAAVQASGRQAAEDAAKILDESSQRTEKAVGNVTEALEAWKESTLAMNSSLVQTNSELDRHKQGLTSASTRISEAGSAFAGAAESVRSASEPLALTGQQLASAAQSLQLSTQEMGESSRKLTAQITETTQGTSEAIQALEDIWQNHVGHLKDVDGQLERAFVLVTKNLESSLSTLERFNSGFSDKVGDSLGLMASVVQELSDNLEEFQAKR